MNRGRMAITGEEAIEAREGVSSLGCGAVGGAWAMPYDDALVANCLGD